MRRTVELVLDGLHSRAEGDDRIPIALSSETPVERWFGVEILDHGKGAVDLSRAADGLPLLVDHRTSDQVGLIEDVSLDSDGVIRGLMRFSQSTRGQEIRTDVLDGIRKKASVGYRILELVLEKSDKKTGIDTYRATKWAPLEGSIVAIPADASVGVGRSADQDAMPVIVRALETAHVAGEESVEENTTAARDNGAVNQPVITVGAEMAERQRSQSIVELATMHGVAERAATWISEGKSVHEVVADLRTLGAKPTAATTPPKPAAIDISNGEKRSYNIARAIMAAAGARDIDAGYEVEVSQELSRKLNRSVNDNGILISTALGMSQRAGLDSATSTKGVETVYEEQGSFIEMLRKKAMVMQLGAILMPGLQGDVRMPKQTGAGTASWVAENPGADVAESNLLLTSVTMVPRTLQSTTSYSRQLLAQGSIDTDALVRSDLSQIHALALDLAALHGSGASNQPTGIYSASGVTSVAFGGSITFAKVVDMESQIAANDAELGALAYLATPETRGKAKQAQIFTGTNGNPVWQDGEMNGYRAEATNQLSKVLGAGTNEHGLIFGHWASLLIGEWGAIEVVTDPYRLKKQGMIELTTFQLVDVAVRYGTAFCKATGLIP